MASRKASSHFTDGFDFSAEALEGVTDESRWSVNDEVMQMAAKKQVSHFLSLRPKNNSYLHMNNVSFLAEDSVFFIKHQNHQSKRNEETEGQINSPAEINVMVFTSPSPSPT